MLLVVALLLGGLEPSSQRPTFISYQAVEGCPQRDLFERALVYRTDRVRLVTDEADATATITVDISKKKSKFVGKLQLKTSNGTATKQIEGINCQPVSKALSLAAALLLDPEAKTGKLPDVLPPPVIVVEPPIAPIVDAGVVDAGLVEPVVVVDAGPPPELVVVVDAGVDAGVEPTRATPELQFSAFALGRIENAISGQLDFGGGLALQLDVLLPSRLVLATTRVGFSLETGRSISGAAGTVEYFLHGLAHIDAGAAWQLSRYFRPEIGGAVLLFPVTVQGVGADEVTSSLRWLWAVSPYLRLQINLGAWRLAVQGGVGLHLRVEHYRIEPNGEVFSVPQAFGHASLQFGRTIP